MGNKTKHYLFIYNDDMLRIIRFVHFGKRTVLSEPLDVRIFFSKHEK